MQRETLFSDLYERVMGLLTGGQIGTRRTEEGALICYYCGQKLSDYHELEHVMPQASGGTSENANLAITCPACNSSKHARFPLEWLATTSRLDMDEETQRDCLARILCAAYRLYQGAGMPREGLLTPSTVRVELSGPGEDLRIAVDLPLGYDKLYSMADAVIRHNTAFSRPALCDRAQVLSQAEYARLARAMVEAGLVQDMPGNKRELTPAGRELLENLLEGGDE